MPAGLRSKLPTFYTRQLTPETRHLMSDTLHDCIQQVGGEDFRIEKESTLVVMPAGLRIPLPAPELPELVLTAINTFAVSLPACLPPVACSPCHTCVSLAGAALERPRPHFPSFGTTHRQSPELLQPECRHPGGVQSLKECPRYPDQMSQVHVSSGTIGMNSDPSEHVVRIITGAQQSRQSAKSRQTAQKINLSRLGVRQSMFNPCNSYRSFTRIATGAR